MIKECAEVFKSLLVKQGEDFFLDGYIFDPGLYLLVDDDGKVIYKKEIAKGEEPTLEFTELFKEIDYLSGVISTNKALDTKRQIQSNNYLSFWVKKANVLPDKKGAYKLTQKIIDDYYKVLADPVNKYPDEIKPVYNEVEKNIGKVDIEVLRKNRDWIIENIFTLLEDPKDNAGFIKVFFTAEIEKYRDESKRYYAPNVFNYPKMVTELDGVPVGVSGYTMNLNAKKPYMQNHTRKSTVPAFVDTEEAFLYAQLYHFLDIQAKNKRYNIYISFNDGVFALPDDQAPEGYFSGYYLRISREMSGLKIVHSDRITGYNPRINPPIEIKEMVPISSDNKEEIIRSITTINELKLYMNKRFYAGTMLPYLFTEPNEIKITDTVLKNEVITARASFINGFIMGDLRSYWNCLKNQGLKLIKNDISYGRDFYAAVKFDIFYSLQEYFE